MLSDRYSYRVDDRVLITVSEAARRLDTYPNAINRWIAKGELEAFQVEEEQAASVAVLPRCPW